MNKLLNQVRSLAPEVSLITGNTFYWSPEKKQIQYDEKQLGSSEGVWALIHEVAHANLGHTTYETDFELLKLEVEAWERAKSIAQEMGHTIEEEHIQDCLDTYRDWLHRRSTCPTCGSVGLQHSASEYKCHNCNTTWQVTASRFCRPYRRKISSQKEKSPGPIVNQTTFH